MKRITVDISEQTYIYLKELKTKGGSSISFEANALIEQAIKDRLRKRKISFNAKEDNSQHNPAD